MIGAERPASDMTRWARITSSAVCTKLNATKSTPSSRPKRRSAASFSVTDDAGKRTPGALMPLCSPNEPPVTTTVVSSAGDVPTTRSSILPSSSRSRSPSRAERTSSAYCVETRPGPPTASPASIRSSSPSCSSNGCPPGSGPVRIFGPLRSCMMAMCRPVRRDASRIARYDVACDSWVPWEKFRRNTSTPATSSVSRIWELSHAGPTVAMIFV